MGPSSQTQCPEEVVLLNNSGKPIGVMDKSRVHSRNTPLHSAFSVFIFDGQGQMLAQQRSFSKETWPGIWSNACCGHPLPGESHEMAAKRRLKQELGIEVQNLTLALPHFRYRAEKDGIMENEICPVFISFSNQPLCFELDRREVEAVRWVSWEAFAEASEDPDVSAFKDFSPWSLLEARILKSISWIAQRLRRTA